MKRHLAALLMASLFVADVCAWETPERAISEFLAFELNGGRLSGANWPDYITKYIAAPAGYDEPGWDEATVVSGYKVGPVRCTTETICSANVEFILYPSKRLGKLSVVPHERGGKKVSTYNIVKHSNAWLIRPVDPLMGSPIISIETYKQHVKTLGL